MEMYALFESHRFGKQNELKLCPICLSTSFYETNPTNRFHILYQCMGCGKRMSLTSKTYLNNKKLPNAKIYKLIIFVVNNAAISTPKLARIAGVTQTTAWKHKHLITSAIATIGENNATLVLKKLLTVKLLDNTPIVPLSVSERKLTPEDAIEIRRLWNDGIVKKKQDISQLYQISHKMVRCIINREVYTYV